MNLVPRELEKERIHYLGFLAQKRLARGLRLNHPESIALICNVLLEKIRDGDVSVAQLMDLGKQILGINQVMDGVPDLIHEIQIEGTFPDGSKLVTVHSPIVRQDGNLQLALYGSFLPVPALSVFQKAKTEDPSAKPSTEVSPVGKNIFQNLIGAGTIELNKGKKTQKVKVTNLCDRPIQVGSHYHFIETNPLLSFDRGLAYGMRLNISAGTAVRFEPGETKTVTLVEIGGQKIIKGGNNLATGKVDQAKLPAILDKAKHGGFYHVLEHHAPPAEVSNLSISRFDYSQRFGPTTGDLLQLGDTGLVLQVEKDFATYGEEVVFGGGKVIREGMGQNCGIGDKDALDTVITNALIVDYTGIYKADIGIKGGIIAGIGKAGNPDCQDGVTPGMVIGVTTEVIAGERLIVTAGALDTHIHFICPQQALDAVANGTTTLIGGGTGPAHGTCATTCSPGSYHVKFMLQATDELPINYGFTGKANTSSPEGLQEQIEAGAIGLKLHEDWGTTPAAIDCALTIADKNDVQITIHTDTLNESACLEHTVKAINGRTIHSYHTEGAGGGHAPDIIKICREQNVLPSSTNPTRPFTVNTIDEHLDMLMVCHHLDKNIPADVKFAESRIRAGTIAAEDILHDIGALSIMGSDSQAMGRVGEVVTRTWQTAAKMKKQRGHLVPETSNTSNNNNFDNNSHNDNFRIKRYVAKYTINPAIAHGVSHVIGSIEVGKLADLVLWKPAFFGTKPELVLKSGTVAFAQMGDPNASIPTPELVYMRPMFGANSPAHSVAFVSQASVSKNIVQNYKLRKNVIPIKNCRNIGKSHMKFNSTCPNLTVDPETFKVYLHKKEGDKGEELTCIPAKTLPLTQRFFLF